MEFMKWDTGSCRADSAAELAERLGISSLAARVLCARGICDEASARAFLNTRLSSLHDPMLLRDMDLAVERIECALECGEKIAVYGDYDVDGITATYILADYLQSLGAECIYHIPDRADEGYGVNLDAVRNLHHLGVSLVITVDTGITAVEEIAAAKAMGMDFIVTDHHECQQTLPDACAVINPHRADCEYPEKNLAGVGVAFKLICALEEGVAEQYLPFVCIGTIADVMPLVGENRVICANGLSAITRCGNPGLDALICAAGAEGKAMSSDIVGFQLAPRINAAGRMSSASRVVELFSMQDRRQADALAQELCMLNQQRRQTETDIFEQAQAQVEKSFDPRRDHALVVVGDGWHHGVVGIVASRICEKYKRPAVLISVEDGVGKGSGRSVKGVSLFDALTRCSEHLEKFGGHELAAGLSIAAENIPAFRAALNRAVKADMETYQPTMHIDIETAPGELTLEAVRSLRVLEPYGTGNPRPIFRMNDMCAEDIAPIGGGKHLRMTLERSGRFGCVYFGRCEKDLAFEKGERVDAAFAAEINDFRGESVQLMLRDIRPSEKSCGTLFAAAQCYKEFCEGAELSADALEHISVDYADLGAVWRYLVKRGGVKPAELLSKLCGEINSAFGRALTPVKLNVALDIFSELGLASCSGSSRVEIAVVAGQKVNLQNSDIARRLGCVSPASNS